MDTIFWEAIDKMKPLMGELKEGEERRWDDYRNAPLKGVYVFYEDGHPIYVGRSNHVRNRFLFAKMAQLIQVSVIFPGVLAIFLWRYHRLHSLGQGLGYYGVGKHC